MEPKLTLLWIILTHYYMLMQVYNHVRILFWIKYKIKQLSNFLRFTKKKDNIDEWIHI